MRIHNSILEAVGATPLIALDRIRSKDGARLLLKMELLNPGASMKDRIALQIIEDAEKSGLLKPGGDVVELTSGNTGIGLAMACAVMGYRMTAVMSEGNSVERRSILSALGARVELVAQAGRSAPGLVSKEDMELVEERTQELVRELAAFRPDQFNNESNPRAHELGTGREIWEQTGGQVDAFAAAVGTGGTFVGVSRALKSRNPRVKCYAVEPAGAPYLAGREVTNTRHQIQGAGYAMMPGFWDESLADGYLAVSDEEAAEAARRLARQEGVLAGYSTGANLAAAERIARSMPSSAVVVTAACDSGMRYLSGELYRFSG